ncbi:TerB family tellurite resistance protein [Methylomonas sp. UP202]|uniref:tellurite resistance TerB family protein n=1 Tax=Methylomonas sp. UP202 TaxID=3040943 RepID=UPI00247AA543|nr:TerB family tellurite resistance protein [Methylomonas sp. UP202]WGS86092.1 TerB family tellurite resistance protein [Methylomonas sp. UP202]
MLEQIKLFFEKHLSLPSPEVATETQLQEALTALMTEMMTMDDVCQDVERTKILSLVKKCFSLSTEQAGTLMINAEQKRRQAVDYYEFTSTINQYLSPEEKTKFVKSLWQIAYADGNIDPQEEYMVRKIADLLGVSHTDFILAKLRANPNP